MADESNDWKTRAVSFQQDMFLYFGNRMWDKLNQEHLRQKVLLAINGILITEDYSPEENKRADDLVELICNIMRQNGISYDYIFFAVLFIYIKTEKEESVYPIFRLNEYNKEDDKNLLFIEWHTKRVYKGWSDYLKCNKLPQCQICYPKMGIYHAEGNMVFVEFGKSPKNNTADAVLDFGTKAVGIAGPALSGISVCLPVIAPQLIISSVIAVALGSAVSAGRSIFRIFDGTNHGQSVNILECVNIVLNVSAGIAAGGQLVMTGLIKNAILQGVLPTVALLGLNCAQIAFSGLGIIICLLDILIKYKNDELQLIDWFKLSSIFLFIGNIAINVVACKQLLPILLKDCDHMDGLFNMVKNFDFRMVSDVLEVDSLTMFPILRNIVFGSSERFVSLQEFQINNISFCAQLIKDTFNNVLSFCGSLSVFRKIQYAAMDELTCIDQLFIKCGSSIVEQYTMYKNYIEAAYKTQFWRDIVVNNKKIFQSSPVYVLKCLWFSLEKVIWLLSEHDDKELQQMKKELVDFTNIFAVLVNCRTVEGYISAMNFACSMISKALQEKMILLNSDIGLTGKRNRILFCNDILFTLKINLPEIARDYSQNDSDQQFLLQGIGEEPILRQKDINLYLDSLNPDSSSLSREQCFKLASKFTKITLIDLENCSFFGKINDSQFIILEDKTLPNQTKFTIILFWISNDLVIAGETFKAIET